MPTFSFVNVVASRINLTTTITGTVDFGSVDPPLNWYIQGVTNDLKPGSQSGQIGSVNGSFNFSFTVLDTGSSSTVNLILKNTSGSPDIWANRSVSISGSGSISAPIISTSSIDSTNVIIFHNPVSNATEYSLEAFTPDYPQWIMYPFSPMNITNGRIEYPFTLSSDGTYVFRVRAKNSTSTSLYSNESQVTKNTTATATITLTVAKSVYLIGTSSTVDLSWNSIPNATSYTLQFQELGSTIWKAFGVFTNTFAVVSGMSTNTEYKFRVTVGNVISNIVTVSTTITPTPTPTPIMPDIDWINTSFADNIKLTDNVLTGTIFASKTNKWDASFNPNMKMIVQVFDNNNNQVDTFFYSFFFDSAVTASFSLSKNYSYSAITVKLVVQDTNFNTYSVITSKSLTNVIVTGDDTTPTPIMPDIDWINTSFADNIKLTDNVLTGTIFASKTNKWDASFNPNMKMIVQVFDNNNNQVDTFFYSFFFDSAVTASFSLSKNYSYSAITVKLVVQDTNFNTYSVITSKSLTNVIVTGDDTTPTPIMPDIDWINTSFADNIKLTDNVLTGTIFASKTNKWDASFNPNMKMIVQVFDNNNNQVDTFFYSFFFDSAVTASFSLSKNYSYSAITVKLVVQDTNFNTYSVITSKSLTNVIVTGDDTTPTPIMPDIDWINTSFADNIKLTDNVLTGTIFASKTNKWDASFNPNMKMIVQVFDNNNNQVDTFFYSFFFDSAVTASFSLSKNYSYSAITVKLVVQDTNFNTYSVITSKSLTNVIVTGDDTTPTPIMPDIDW